MAVSNLDILRDGVSFSTTELLLGRALDVVTIPCAVKSLVMVVTFKELDKYCPVVVLGSSVDSPAINEVFVDVDSMLDCNIRVETLFLPCVVNVLLCENLIVEFTCSNEGEINTAVVRLDIKPEVEFKAEMFPIEDEIDAAMET